MEGLLSKLNASKWIILGAFLILILLWIAWPFLDVFIYAIFFYYVARPIKDRLRPYIKNETLLVTCCLLLLVLPLALVMGYTVLLGISQVNALFQFISDRAIPAGPLSNMSAIVSGIQAQLSPESVGSRDIGAAIGELYHRGVALLESTSGVRGIILATGMTFADIVFKAFLIMVVVFYMLRDGDKLKAWFASTFPGLVRERDGMLPRYYKAVDHDLESIFFGNILSIVIFAAIAAIVYSILNFFAPDPTFVIPVPMLLGILLGIAALLPLVGAWTIDIPILLYILIRSLMAGTFFDNAGYFLLMAAVIFIFVETLPGYLLRPFISHGDIHVGLLMFAYILGPLVFGISGLFTAVIVLVLLTYYFRIIVPELTKNSNMAQANP